MKTMPEYIARQKLINAIPIVNEDKQISLYGAVADFMVIALSIPTADVVEVVRCKNCKKWDTSQKFLTYCACSRWSLSKSQSRLTAPDAFCSFGERKEGAEE